MKCKGQRKTESFKECLHKSNEIIFLFNLKASKVQKNFQTKQIDTSLTLILFILATFFKSDQIHLAFHNELHTYIHCATYMKLL